MDQFYSIDFFGSYGLTLATTEGKSRLNNCRDTAENGYTRKWDEDKQNKKHNKEKEGMNNTDNTKTRA